MTQQEITEWLLAHRLLLTTTQKPTQAEAEMIFKIADQLDTTQKHKMTSCSRCYYNAKQAIKTRLNIF